MLINIPNPKFNRHSRRISLHIRDAKCDSERRRMETTSRIHEKDNNNNPFEETRQRYVRPKYVVGVLFSCQRVVVFARLVAEFDSRAENAIHRSRRWEKGYRNWRRRKSQIQSRILRIDGDRGTRKRRSNSVRGHTPGSVFVKHNIFLHGIYI